MHNIIINQLLIENYLSYNIPTYTNAALQILLDTTTYHVNTSITNSKFHSMNQPSLVIKNSLSLTTNCIFIINCTFELITARPTIRIYVSPFNKTVNFINCKFCYNSELIVITTVAYEYFELTVTDAIISTNMILTNISLVKCQFINNIHTLIVTENRNPVLSNLKVNILFESLIITRNHVSAGARANMISITTMNVHINGTFNVTNNRCRQVIIHFQSCDILFSGKMIFNKNDCKEVISTNTHIKVMEYTNISFLKNGCENNVILVEGSNEYYQPYPLCLFQYITMNISIVTKT